MSGTGTGSPRISARWGYMPIYARSTAARSLPVQDGTVTRTDVAIDGGYQFLGDGSNTATVDAILTHEDQNLNASNAIGASSRPGNHLDQVCLNVTYFYHSTYGINFGGQNTWGNANPAVLSGGC
jgi:hypothetical protein